MHVSEKQGSINVDKSQPIFMGIDVHKKQWSVMMIHQNEIVKKCTLEGKVEILYSLIKHYEGHSMYSVYEAGFSGFHLHRALVQEGVKNIVTPPNKIPTLTGDRVKTDRRDSEKLARYLSQGLLKAIYVPSEELVNLRQLLRTREQYVCKRRRVITQLKMLLIQYGIQSDTVGITKKYREELLTLELPSMIRLSVETYLAELSFLDEQLKHFDDIYRHGPKDSSYALGYEKLVKVPGIGPLTATTLLYEIGDWKRFKNMRQIASYVGLTPSEYSSGEHIYKGNITGQGNRILRSLLIEASWKLIDKDMKMKEFYERLKHKKGAKKAIVAVARKFIGILFIIMTTDKEYEYRGTNITHMSSAAVSTN